MKTVQGLKCPQCGSWYSAGTSEIDSGFSAGDVCGNQAMTGPHPERCSPEHPCRGILVPVAVQTAKAAGK